VVVLIAYYIYLCGGYFSKGKDILDWSNSKKHLEAALKLYDKDPVSYTLLAAVSYELKEDDKVIDYYWKAFELDFLATLHDWRSSAAVVGVYVLRGKFDEAKNILDLQQDFFPEIKNSKKFQLVKDYYEKALQKANNSDIARSS
jgi:tetratricopeptide (TPR) repeat protein